MRRQIAKNAWPMSGENAISAFRPMPRTGVIYVTTEANRLGCRANSSDAADWCNLGQGQPETGALAVAPPWRHTVSIEVDDQEYAPVAGIRELRQSIAELYSHPSSTTWENVCTAGCGRTSLTRAAASLGSVHLGHFLPD